MSDRIRLHGIEVFAHHGVLPAERELGQRFVVDVDLFTSCEAAVRSDALADALDYSVVHERVRSAATATTFQLIEAVAGHLCRQLLADFPAERVVVTVHKVNPPIPGFQGSASVTLERDRAWFLAGPGA